MDLMGPSSSLCVHNSRSSNKGKQRESGSKTLQQHHPSSSTCSHPDSSCSCSSSSSSSSSSSAPTSSLSEPSNLSPFHSIDLVTHSSPTLSTPRRPRRPSAKIRSTPFLFLFFISSLLPIPTNAINVTLPPEGFIQCADAVTYFTSEGRVLVDVRYTDDLGQAINETIPDGQQFWNWTSVDLPAGTPFILLFTDQLIRSTYDPANPVFKAPFEQSLSHATVLPSPTNDSSCLRIRTRHRWEPKHGSGIEAPIIAGVLGGLLFFFLALILCICWRRRNEKSDPNVIGYPSDGNQGDNNGGGWSYMASLVPGLTPSNNHNNGNGNANSGGRRRRRGIRTRRRQSDQDVELPSYGQSQKDAKGPPKYLHEFEDDDFEEEYPREERVATEGDVSADVMLARPQQSEPPSSRHPTEWQTQSTPRRGPSVRSSDNANQNSLPRSSGVLGRNSDPFELEYDLPSPSRSHIQEESNATRDSRVTGNQSGIEMENQEANDSTAALVGRNHDHPQFERSSSPDQENERRSFMESHQTQNPFAEMNGGQPPQSNTQISLEHLNHTGRNESFPSRGGRTPIAYPYRNGQTPRGYGASENQTGGYL